MNLLIVDNNISYANNLKKVLAYNILKFESIQVVRDISKIINDNLATYNVILLDVNKQNLSDVEHYLKKNKTSLTKFVALTKEADTKQIMNAVQTGVSSIIYKTEKTEFIVEELNLVLRGKVILPQKIINKMKEKISIKELEKPNSPIKKMLAKYISN